MATSDEQTHQQDGTLWRPKQGGTSSFEEFLHAREHWLELFHETGVRNELVTTDR